MYFLSDIDARIDTNKEYIDLIAPFTLRVSISISINTNVEAGVSFKWVLDQSKASMLASTLLTLSVNTA